MIPFIIVTPPPYYRNLVTYTFRVQESPFIARLFYRRALHPRAFSLAAQFTLLQELEIADSSCAFAPGPEAKSTHSKRGILKRERYIFNLYRHGYKKFG